MAATFVDDKTPLCVPFILENLEEHRKHQQTASSRPFIVGINGVQGAGKTTLVKNLEKELKGKGFETLVCSIDDFYKTREDHVKLAEERSDNALYQHRGVPGELTNCSP
jgi:D-glycerate 3-kinase